MNIINKKVLENIVFAMQYSSKLELIFCNSYSHFFSIFCKNVKNAIKKLKTRHPIFLFKQKY